MRDQGEVHPGGSRTRLLLVVVALVMAAWVAACGAPAQPTAKPVSWPDKDVTLIVPFKAGGGFDLTARMVAPFLEKHAGKKVNVVVKNVEGASGKVGLQEVLSAKPDGYTIGVFDPVLLGTMQVMGDLGQTDMSKMSWVGQLDWGAGLVAMAANGKFKTLDEMKGKEVRFSTSGQASFGAVMLGRALGATPKLVVYSSSIDGALAVQRGDADITVFTWPSLFKQVNASEGKLISVFLATDKRDSHMPNVPSAPEVNVKIDGSIMGAAHILAGPPGVSPEVMQIMTDVLKKAMADPEYVAQMEKAGYPPVPLFGKDLSDTIANVAKVMEANKDVVKSLAQ